MLLGNPVPDRLRTWRDLITIHPAAELFPMMGDEELRALGDDIKKHGMKQPLVFYSNVRRHLSGDPQHQVDGQKKAHQAKVAMQLPLIDGRNRLAAMALVGILDAEALQKAANNGKIIWGEDTPEAFVVSANIRRRHLTGEQKRELIRKLVKAQPEKSDRQIAATAKVDHKTVAAVRTEVEGRGEIPHAETRTDSKGREQPATKAAKTPPAKVTEPSYHTEIVIAFGVELHDDPAQTLDNLTQLLQDEQTRISETILLDQRIVLARGYLNALGVTLEDLQPNGGMTD